MRCASLVPTTAWEASSAGQVPSIFHHERMVDTPRVVDSPVESLTSLLNQAPAARTSVPSEFSLPTPEPVTLTEPDSLGVRSTML